MGVLIIKPKTRLWTPSQISTLLWLDAFDASTVSIEGGEVSQWRDKSGNNRHATQADVTKRLTYANNAVTAGNNRFMEFPRISNVRFIFICHKWLNTSGDFRNILGDTSSFDYTGGSDGTSLFDATFSSELVRNGEGFVNGFQTAPTSMVRYTTPTILSVSQTGNTSASLLANDRNFTSRNFIGEFYKIVLMDSIPSLDIRQKLEGWAAYDMNVSLPLNHPYRDSPPRI